VNIKAYQQINEKLQAQNVKLIAISKTKPVSDIKTLYDLGHRAFGENRAKELQSKAQTLPNDIEWHMVGHMQSNKVKHVAPFVKLIHSVDSYSLLQEINKRANQNKRTIDVLLQMHIAEESSKYGFNSNEIHDMLSTEKIETLQNIRIVGLMGMATFTDDEAQIRKEFQHLHSIFTTLKSSFLKDEDNFKELSIGMSGDYEIAITEGATMVRIGSLLFGARS